MLQSRTGVTRSENVAQRRNATEPIPDDGDHKSGDQQAWSAEDRQQLTAFVDEQASTAIDDVSCSCLDYHVDALVCDGIAINDDVCVADDRLD